MSSTAPDDAKCARARVVPFEAVAVASMAALTAWSLLAVALATAGLFRTGWLVLSWVVACGVGALCYIRLHSVLTPISQAEALRAAPIFAASFLLFFWPAEHFPLLGDSAIYPNTATLLAQTGSLTYHYTPLDGLDLPEKQLFYVPADRQLPYINFQSYDGLLYGAYYVTDPEQNTVVSSRPPLLVAWMALLAKIAGPRATIYATPIFGLLGLAVVYLLGRRLFGAGTGLLAALWLVLSFPQLHFSRTPYAEAAGQFFVLTALYGLVAYLQSRRSLFIFLGVAAVAASFAARLDALLIVGTLGFFLAILSGYKDRKGLALTLLAITGALAFSIWTVNRPYIGATVELLLIGQLRFMRSIWPWVLLVPGVVTLSVCAWLWYRRPPGWAARLARWILSVAVVLAVIYGLYIRPLRPEFSISASGPVPTLNEELISVPALYLGHILFWLAAVGVVLVVWRYRILSPQMLLVAFFLSFGAAFFWKYTTARVYPVALRRLLPEVIPSLMLFGAFATWQLKRRYPRFAAVTATVVAIWLIAVSARYWALRESQGTWTFTDQLARRFTAEDVLLFEPLEADSVVGWFAAPLWSFYDRRALLLQTEEQDALNADTLQMAICTWQGEGRRVYVIAQTDPSGWWPGLLKGDSVEEVRWRSNLIGQSRLFPPFIWPFEFVFQIYHLEDAPC